jgi:hypothetical protein
MSRDLVLGLDGGGTKTFAITVDRQGMLVRIAQQIPDRTEGMLARHVTAADGLAGEDEPKAFISGVSTSQTMLRDPSHRLNKAPKAYKLPPVGGAAWRAPPGGPFMRRLGTRWNSDKPVQLGAGNQFSQQSNDQVNQLLRVIP